MHYAVVNAPPGSTGKPYRFFKFRTLNAAHKCQEVDEFALVYESQEQLEMLCHPDDIKGILTAVGVEVPSVVTATALAKALHRLVEETATTWSSEKAEETTQEEEPDMATAKKSKKPAKAKTKTTTKPVKKERKTPLKDKARGPLAQTGKIKVLAKNPAREGTIRHANLEVILNSKTLEEALRNLRNMTPPGGMIDVRFAVANGLIEILNG